jgi:hypothetical protein
MIPDHQPTPPQPPPHQGTFPDKAPALLRDLSKIRESGIGIDTTGQKESCSLTTVIERSTFNPRKITGPVLKGLTIILTLKFG